MTAYYNEFDPYAAQWLRNLIDAGHIAPGVVDERSIEDVIPSDIEGFTQCHFFAGVGVWSLALRRAGWPDNRPVWTGSCPCQPFSTAGAGAGFEDSRHLWPTFAWIIKQCQPPVVFGEQVASKAIDPWIDDVHADLEALGYAFGGVPFPSAGVGAPHIRDRLFWVAQSEHSGRKTGEQERSWPGSTLSPGTDRRVADAYGGLQSRSFCPGSAAIAAAKWAQSSEADSGCSGDLWAGPVNGLWSSVDWLGCRDGKWRPVEPGTSPLAHGAASRVGRLRAYGNAINAEAAKEFIAAYLETQPK